MSAKKREKNMPKANEDLLDMIYERQAHMSKGQRKIANFLIHHYDKAVYLTAAKLAEMIGVSESTVVRFAMELGFGGYPQLKTALEELVIKKLTATQRVEIGSGRILKKDKGILKSVLHNDAERILKTADTIDPDMFNEAVSAILKAKKVYIVGGRSSSPLAQFLAFYLNLMIENVIHTGASSASELFEQIFRIQEGDLCICISFPRYSQRTVQALEYAKQQGAATVALTDSQSSPLASIADYPLIAGSDMISFIDSLVAPMSVINALLVAVSLETQGKLLATLDRLEDLWNRYQVYSSHLDYKYIDRNEREI